MIRITDPKYGKSVVTDVQMDELKLPCADRMKCIPMTSKVGCVVYKGSCRYPK